MSLINFIDDYVDYYGLTKTENKYFYKGIPVPRTTEILSSMLHEEYLMEWSNYLGRYQRKDYNEYLCDLLGIKPIIKNQNLIKERTR